MIKLPPNGIWSKPNNSDKFGSVWATKNMNFDEEGYIKLSPRTVKVMDESTNGNFGIPLAIGRYTNGKFQVTTSSNANFVAKISTTAAQYGFDEDTGTANPTCTTNSHGVFWQKRWHVSTNSTVVYKTGSDDATATWTSAITGLTSSVPHYLEVFKSRNNLCVTNGNVVKQYDTAYSGTQDLTLPSDFTATGLAYNNQQIAIATKTASSSFAPSSNAFLFIWDGTTAAASAGFDTGADEIFAIAPYKSSFVVITTTGQLLYFNGGGFDNIANFPFYYEDKVLGGIDQQTHYGTIIVADGDVLYMNIAAFMSPFGRNEEKHTVSTPSGVWCYDPKVGLYHRWSPSLSFLSTFDVTSSNVNASTDTLTVSSGTVPQTGSIARQVEQTVGSIGGVVQGRDYFVIKTGATTFRLAETREKALNGIYIDITSAPSSGTNTFYIFDIVDYSVSQYDKAGAVAIFGSTSTRFTDILVGGDFNTSAGAANDTLCMGVPFLENRGWFMTPKIFSTGVEDNYQKLYIKHRPLKTNDSIIVKARTKNIEGIPMSLPTSLYGTITWTGANSFYTSANLSDVKTAVDAGEDIECEITSGAAAGQMAQVTSVDYESDVYSVVLDEDLLGASSDLVSTCSFDNWKVLASITSDGDGYHEIPFADEGKWAQFKIELRGDATTIEEINIIDTKHKDSA